MTASMDRPEPVPEPHGSLASPSFVSLVVVQALGTINDNVFRWLTVPIAVHWWGTQHEPLVLSLGLVLFTLPFLLLANLSGWLSDRFAKRTVIIGCKALEIGLAVFLMAAILGGHVESMMLAVFLIGAQAALFSPAKYACIPENLPTEKLSAGNGIMGLVTVLSAALGTVLAYWLYDQTKPDGRVNAMLSASVVLGLAIVGTVLSLAIRSGPAARPDLPFPVNPFSGLVSQMRVLIGDKTLLRTALGIMFFWSLASLVQMNVVTFTDELGFPKSASGELLAVLVLGVGTGSVLAGVWSAGRVELGLVPPGATLVAIFALGLYLVGGRVEPESALAAQWAWRLSEILLFCLGAGAGLFNVPLDSNLQDRSPVEQRGSILSASNFLTFSGMLMCAGLFYVLKDVLHLSARQIFLVLGLATIPVAVYVWLLLPKASVRFWFHFTLALMYRMKVRGMENVPRTGGMLMVPNHVTWVDGFLLQAFLPRDIRFVAFSANVEKGIGGWISRLFGTIPINNSDGPKALVKSLQLAKQALMNGDCVCIFAEGTLTRTGQMQPFQRGMMKILDGTNVPVVPIYLEGLWGSIFSFRDGKFFKKWPRKWPYPVTIHVGQPIAKLESHWHAQRAVEALGVVAAQQRKDSDMIPPQRFLRMCRSKWSEDKLADSTGDVLKGREVLIRTLVLRRLLSRTLAPDERMVGVLLPPSIGACLVNAALPLMGRVGINLNYTAGVDTLNSCIEQTGIRHVLTSRKFMEKVKITLNAEYVYLEDFKEKVTGSDKLVAAALAYAAPAWLLDRVCGLHKQGPDDLLTIIFTSGSTGKPKGVMLSHANVNSNLDAIDGLFQLKRQDGFLGILPFFHSTGYTATLWSVLTLLPKGVYHYNPLDARVIGDLCQKHKVTILITTPTFLRTYYKRCDKEQLSGLDLVICGAEKLPRELATAFEEKFGIAPIEGYGTTELSPLAAVNVPDHRSAEVEQKGTKIGTVGRPIPQTMAKVIDTDTGADLGLDTPGLLCIKGPNVMLGYYKQPELTAKSITDGWYSTGDIARLDAEGFITITDRQSRFSKIGGEMVPHLSIEERLLEILKTGDDRDQELKLAVTSVPCDKKGERLIVLHKPLPKPVDEVHKALENCGLPNLWLPSRDAFIPVDDIPVLGTGKVDLRGLKALALEKTASA
jgi:acyl-[acyl-carrier-protein]-phospholipid O-acyltransferase / long-chain-fatty-acid--[acyl-carrier-protein] ligase